MGNFVQDIKVNDEEISPEVVDCIKNRTSVNSKFCRNSNDIIVRNLALAFDINNNVCLGEFKKNLECYYNRINDNKCRINWIYDEVIDYLEKRNDNYVR